MSAVAADSDSDDWSVAMPLWLPYIIFTVVLLSLIVVSFARFHVLRGAQYRNRQLADERSMGVNGTKNGSDGIIICFTPKYANNATEQQAEIQ